MNLKSTPKKEHIKTSSLVTFSSWIIFFFLLFLRCCYGVDCVISRLQNDHRLMKENAQIIFLSKKKRNKKETTPTKHNCMCFPAIFTIFCIFIFNSTCMLCLYHMYWEQWITEIHPLTPNIESFTFRNTRICDLT